MRALIALTTALAIGTAGLAFAQDAGGASASTLGTGGAATGTDGSSAGTIAGGGSAAAGGTSASTLGTAGTSTGVDGETSSSIASGGSAAAADGNAKSRTKIVENPAQVKGMSKAMANDGGTFSKSMTKTRVKDGELSTDTKSMAHEPGQKPVKSSTSTDVQTGD